MSINIELFGFVLNGLQHKGTTNKLQSGKSWSGPESDCQFPHYPYNNDSLQDYSLLFFFSTSDFRSKNCLLNFYYSSFRGLGCFKSLYPFDLEMISMTAVCYNDFSQKLQDQVFVGKGESLSGYCVLLYNRPGTERQVKILS